MIETIKKHAVLICISISVILILTAVFVYPGGSLADKNSQGFEWSKNFISNLFQARAINGLENPSRIWAIPGMVFHALGYGLFFINMSKKMPVKHAVNVLKFIGIAGVLADLLIATPLHDLAIPVSSGLFLMGLFYITIFILRSKLHVLKICCIACLLLFYYTLFLYGMGNWTLLAIMQKVSLIASVLLVLALTYLTKLEDFIPRTSQGSFRR